MHPTRHSVAAAAALIITGAMLFAVPQVAQAQAKAKPAPKAAAPALELFGTPLKGVNRSTLREALRKGGMRPTREDDRYWVDQYDASAVLDGASEFSAGYVYASGEFAFARYRFNAFMDTGLVTKVADMVINKYGPPSKREGDARLGEVRYQWNLPQGMRIEVRRGWPDTTTYLVYTDNAANARMEAEIEETRKQADQEKARSQSHAF